MKRMTLAIALVTAFYPANLIAQTAPGPQTGEESSSTEIASGAIADVDRTKPLNSPRQTPPEVAALDGSGPISMSLIRRPHLLVGGTVSGGYDSDPQNLGNSAPTASVAFSPYVGMQGGNLRTQVIAQYHPTISRYTSYEGQSMQVASFKIASSVSPRLEWNIGVDGSHGDDSLRLWAPSSSSLVNGIPVSGGGSASFLPNAGTVTNAEGGFQIRYSTSQISLFDLRLSDSYNSTPDLHQKGSVAAANLDYSRSIRPTVTLLVYGQNAYYYGDLNCAAVGAGVGVQWQPSEATTIVAKGGPQIDSHGCNSQQGFSYNTAITKKLPWRSQFYLTAARQPVISYLGSGLWQDDVSGGYERRFQTANALSFDAGYIQSSTLVDASSYSGTFFDATYTRELSKGLSLRSSYRIFTGRSGETDINRNVVQFALTFTPNTGLQDR